MVFPKLNRPGYSASTHKGDAPGPLPSLCPSAGLLLRVPCLFWTGAPRTGHSILNGALSGQSRWEGSPPLACWPCSFYCTPGYHWPFWPQRYTFVSYSTCCLPRSFSAELLSSRSTPNLYWCMQLLLPRWRTLHLLTIIRILSTQLSSLSRSHWMVTQPSGVSATPPSFVSPANLLRVHSMPSFRSLIKKIIISLGRKMYSFLIILLLIDLITVLLLEEVSTWDTRVKMLISLSLVSELDWMEQHLLFKSKYYFFLTASFWKRLIGKTKITKPPHFYWTFSFH